MTIDQQLLERIMSKDKYALELLVDRYQLLLWKICWKEQADPVICERFVTQVFQQLWNRPEEFTGEKRFTLLLVTYCKEKTTELEFLKILHKNESALKDARRK